MTKKKAVKKEKEVIVATYHGNDEEKKYTLAQLEKENDLATLYYLEACAKVRSLEEELNKSRALRTHKEGVFTEARCRYLAAKRGIEREPNRDGRKSFWTAEEIAAMSYAK